MAKVGVTNGLAFELRWDAPVAHGSAAEATLGRLAVWVDSSVVWGRPANQRVVGLHWSWVDLLEHLALRWTDLVWEELDPLDKGEAPWGLRKSVEPTWRRLDPTARDQQQRDVLRYEDAHSLASALGGTDVPDLWIFRQGQRIALRTERRTRWRPVPEVLATLGALGDAIAERLASVQDERSQSARAAWAERENATSLRVLEVATCLTPAVIAELQAGMSDEVAWGLRPALSSPTELMVAARMLGRASPSVTATVLGWIRATPHLPTPDLDSMTDEAMNRVEEWTTPHVAGRELASWLRTVPGVVGSGGRVDLDALLASYNVQISERALSIESIDAVCCWGPSAGPAILLNSSGTRAQGPEGRRATLAHELCHLLVDRRRTLPVAEVMGGRVPNAPEKRANAFAAELLLPNETAGWTVSRASDVRAAVNDLRATFGASLEIIAWQAVRSAYCTSLSKKAIDFLSSVVSDPIRLRAAASS